MITLPEGKSVWLVHDFRSRKGTGVGVNNVWGGLVGIGEALRLGFKESGRGLLVLDEDPRGVVDKGLIELLYSIMLNMFSGCLLVVMMVVTPAAVAISAAMSLVSIPPVPRLEPSVVVLTLRRFRLVSYLSTYVCVRHLQHGLLQSMILLELIWLRDPCGDLRCKDHLRLSVRKDNRHVSWMK
jgi:hypothetical protein